RHTRSYGDWSSDVCSSDLQTQLLARLTHILLKWEEAPETPQAKSIAWAYVQEVKAGAMTVGGTIPEIPRYRVMTTVPQGSLNDEIGRASCRDNAKSIAKYA